MATIKAIYEKEDRINRFNAAMQGVDLGEAKKDTQTNDITDLKGYDAAEAGFGINLGLGYTVEE